MENFPTVSFTMTVRSSNKISKLLSPLIFLLFWYILSFLISAPLILPYPHTVLLRLIQLVQTKAFWCAFCFTMLRVFAAFTISFVTGNLLGYFSARSNVFKNLISFPLSVIRTIPLIAFILLALFWFSSGKVPVFVAVIMALPVVITGAEKGFENNRENSEKLFKASCYCFTGFKAFWYIRLPAALPSVLSAAESSFGLCWKVVAAGEVISIPRYAAGTLMQKAQVHLETADVLAVTVVLVLVSYTCGKIIHNLIK